MRRDDGNVVPRARRVSYLLLFLALFATTYPNAFAERRESPESIPGSVKVDAEGLIELVDRIPEIIMVDSRIESDRIQGHIEGSISLPDEKTTCESLSRVVSTKQAPVLFYCNGPKCGRSATAVEIALQCGYSNVYWFRGGFEEWKAKKYPYIKE